jgi:hypothetical protein
VLQFVQALQLGAVVRALLGRRWRVLLRRLWPLLWLSLLTGLALTGLAWSVTWLDALSSLDMSAPQTR